MLLCVAAGGQPEFKEMDRGLAGDLPEPAEMEREAGRDSPEFTEVCKGVVPCCS